MTKKELVYLIRRRTLLPEYQVKIVTDMIFEIIVTELKSHHHVKIHNFGTFRPSKYLQRRSMKFVAGRLVKEYLNF